MKKRFIKGLFLMIVIFTFGTLTVSAHSIGYTPYNVYAYRQETLYSGYVYAEYDWGTWWPNDDAYVLAEAQDYQTDTIKYVMAHAVAQGYEDTHSAGGKESKLYYVVGQLGGIDFLDTGSYAEASTTYCSLYAKIIVS